MWTTENRPRFDRTGLRYPSDLTDAEWALLEPLIPPAKRGGRRREVVVRDVLNGVMYISQHGVPMACVAEGPSTTQHRAQVFSAMGLRRNPDENP